MVEFTCGHELLVEIRKNPMTGDILFLCKSHAMLHDDGISFRVWPLEDKST